MSEKPVDSNTELGNIHKHVTQSESKSKWPKNNGKVEDGGWPDIYNKDSLTDRMDILCNFILTSKHYSDILYSLNAKPMVTVRVNPAEDPRLVEIFNNEPEEFPHLFRAALISLAPTPKVKDNIRMHTKVEVSEATQIKLHQWGADLEGVPVAVDCQVIGVNKQETYTKFAQAYCSVCGQSEQLLALGRLPRCPDKDCDGHKKAMVFDKSTLKTGDIRTVVIQEPIEESHGRTPVNFDCLLKDQYALQVHIGQRIKLIGTFRSYPQEKKITNQVLINAISIYPLGDTKEVQPTDVQIEYFENLVKEKDALARVSQSIAPEIIHEDLAKLCVLLSLIGAPEIDSIVGLIHAFLVGNPGGGKSTIMQYVLKLRKKSGMAVGGTMTGSGITVTMDNLPNRMRIPRAGIIPQCSGGVAVIDELGQVDPEDHGKMHQCMASGWINYDKGGFHEVVEAKTTIIAGANPKHFVYDTKETAMKNVNLSPALIDRFDFKVNMSKKKSPDQRREVLQHINLIKRIGVSKYIQQAKLLIPEDLAAFISYCKTIDPVPTDESEKLAMEFQIMIESIEQPEGSLPTDNRFYNSVLKVSQAIARFYHSKKVTAEHTIVAIEIMKKCLLTFDMTVEKGQTQATLGQAGKKISDCAENVCQLLSKTSADGRFYQHEFCNKAVEMYPEFFPYYGKALKYFEKMEDSMSCIDGRYKLA